MHLISVHTSPVIATYNITCERHRRSSISLNVDHILLNTFDFAMDAQKRKRNYFSINHNYQKKRREYNLEPGIKGFFCTCNFHEKDCVREAYNVLSEFADNLYGPETKSSQTSDEKASTVKKASENWREKEPEIGDEEDEEEEDISTALNKEVAELKAESKKPVALRRFQVVDTGVKSVVFIRTTVPDPLELVSTIVRQLDETKKQRTRFLMRLLPVELVCKAKMDDIKLKADPLLGKYFTQEPKTFSIVFNRHSNNNVQRNHVIEELADIIAKKNPGNKADLKNPELAVVVEVIRGVCLISIAPNYYKYKKYNLLEICGVKEPGKKESTDVAPPVSADPNPEGEEEEPAKEVEPTCDRKMNAEAEIAIEDK